MNLDDNLTSEQRLIVLASRLSFSDEDEQELAKLVKEKLDWFQIFRMAVKNKVIPLIGSNLEIRHYEEAVPDRLWRVFHFYSLGTKERNSVFFKELEQVVTAMNSNNVPCTPVKGVYLIPEVYKDPRIRTMNDIDCLIKRSDVSRVRAVMNSLGYTQGNFDPITNSIIPPTREQSLFWKIGTHNLMSFQKIAESDYARVVTFDFSFALDLSRNTKPVDLMISRAENHENSPYKYLKPSDFFIHQCCHHYREASTATWVLMNSDLNIIKFCDVREYILQKMNESQLLEAIQFAEEHDLEKAVYFVLYYLNEIYGDGYEKPLMDTLDLEDQSFLYRFGEKDLGYGITWKKDFWQRLFSDSNKDEVTEKPEHFNIVFPSRDL